MEDKTYVESWELKKIADKLIERYYLYLGHVQTDNIYFADIIGAKPKKATIMQIGGVNSPWVKQFIQKQNGALYCVSVWKDEWDETFPPQQEWLVFDALMRIDPHNDGKLVKPDVNEFGNIIEYLGPYWRSKTDLPSLLGGDEPLPIPLPAYNSDEGSSVNF